MRTYITAFLEEYDYPAEAGKTLLQAYDAIFSSEKAAAFSSLLDAYAQGNTPDPGAILQEMKAISDAAGVHEYTGALLLLICCSRQLKEYYKAAGLSREIYKTTMFDLKYKLTECRLVKGVWGTFVAPWLAGYFDLSRFGLGRLQFEIRELKASYSKNGLTLCPESKVINVHIPRTGGRLDEESRKRAYAMAAEFFSARYGLDPVVFYCSSWLLFPKHQQIMKEGSNLLSFIRDYDIIEAGEYEDYSETWRLFDMDYTEDHSLLPADSSLRREYINMMDRGEKTGWGKGIYFYKG